MKAAWGRKLRIADEGSILTLDYGGALAAHCGGTSWFGVATGFRMLQAAACTLSVERLWDRRDLFVVGGHPGIGVRDAVDYVTGCVARGRYHVHAGGADCGPGMRFAWSVDDGRLAVSLHMRDDFIPQEFHDLLARRGGSRERADDVRRLARLKRRLARALWRFPLEELFAIEVSAMRKRASA